MICKLMRFLISNAIDSDKDQSALMKWHLHACPDCQRFQTLSESMVHRLVEDAAADSGFVAVSAPVPLLMMHRWLAFASIILLLGASGYFALERISGAKEIATNGIWLIDAVEDFQSAGRDVVEGRPLQEELQFLLEDTEVALDTLIACTGFDARSFMSDTWDYRLVD